jgi:hypothetical protein
VEAAVATEVEEVVEGEVVVEVERLGSRRSGRRRRTLLT